MVGIMIRLLLAVFLCSGSIPAAAAPWSDPGEPALPALVPESALVYLELEAPGPWIADLPTSKPGRRLRASPLWREFEASPEYQQMEFGLNWFEGTLGRPLNETLATAAGISAALALRPDGATRRPQALFLLRGKRAREQQALWETLRRIPLDGHAWTREEREGVPLYSRGSSSSLHGFCLGLHARALLGPGLPPRDPASPRARRRRRRVARRFRPLPSRPQGDAANGPGLRLRRPAAVLRHARTGRRSSRAPRQPGGRDPLLGRARAPPRGPVRATLALERDDALLVDLSWGAAAAARPGAGPSTMDLPVVPRRQATLALSRDLGRFWESREKLLAPAALAGLAQFDTTIALLFGGRTLGEELLPWLRPEILLVAQRQEWTQQGRRAPVVKLPGFALVFRLKDPERGGPELEVAFQTVLGFVNLDRGQKGLPPYRLETTTHDGLTSWTMRPLVAEPEPGIAANYEWSALRSSDRFVIASTPALARDLGRAFAAGAV